MSHILQLILLLIIYACNGYTFSVLLFCLSVLSRNRPLLPLAQRHKQNVETNTSKVFCGKTSHYLFSVIQVILHLGPLRCAGEHTLHYLDGQSLRNPTVFGPAEEHSSKNIIPTMCEFLCRINWTYRYVHSSLRPYFNVKVAKG